MSIWGFGTLPNGTLVVLMLTPATRTPTKFWPHWGLIQKPSVSQPSPLQTEPNVGQQGGVQPRSGLPSPQWGQADVCALLHVAVSLSAAVSLQHVHSSQGYLHKHLEKTPGTNSFRAS